MIVSGNARYNRLQLHGLSVLVQSDILKDIQDLLKDIECSPQADLYVKK